MAEKLQENMIRLIRLADEFLGTRNDPSQISVNQKVMAKLRKIHSSTLTEKKSEERTGRMDSRYSYHERSDETIHQKTN
jgi:hypothetical protein